MLITAIPRLPWRLVPSPKTNACYVGESIWIGRSGKTAVGPTLDPGLNFTPVDFCIVFYLLSAGLQVVSYIYKTLTYFATPVFLRISSHSNCSFAQLLGIRTVTFRTNIIRHNNLPLQNNAMGRCAYERVGRMGDLENVLILACYSFPSGLFPCC